MHLALHNHRFRIRSSHRGISTKAREEYSIEVEQKGTSGVAIASQLADVPVLEHNGKPFWLVTMTIKEH